MLGSRHQKRRTLLSWLQLWKDWQTSKEESINTWWCLVCNQEGKKKLKKVKCLRKTVKTSLREIKIGTTKPCYLGVFHKPPRKKNYQIPFEDISLIIEFLKTKRLGKLILTGDFNIPQTSWEMYQSGNDCKETTINFANENHWSSM